MTAVSNSACLIALDRIDRLELLTSLFDSILIPEAVDSECGDAARFCTVRSVANESLAAALALQVDGGEAEAIALALEESNDVLILDDKKARKLATGMGIKVIGTVGVVLRAKQAGLIDEVKQVLDSLIASNFRVSDVLYNEALNLANET